MANMFINIVMISIHNTGGIILALVEPTKLQKFFVDNIVIDNISVALRLWLDPLTPKSQRHKKILSKKKRESFLISPLIGFLKCSIVYQRTGACSSSTTAVGAAVGVSCAATDGTTAGNNSD